MAAVAAVATATSLLMVTPSAVAKPKPPPKVSQGQVDAAASEKTAVATQVGQLSAQVAEAKAELVRLEGQRELAEQKVAFAVSELQKAEQSAQTAHDKVVAAARTVDDAHRKFVQFVQASYMDGSTSGMTGTLLTASNPTNLLDQSALQQYQAQGKIDAIGNLQRATVVKSNADAQARAAVANRTKAAKAAKAAKQAADDAVASQAAQKATLTASLGAKENELAATQLRLATLTNQRATWLKYQAHLRYLAHLAYLAKLRREAEQRRQAAAAAAAAARARAAQHGNGGGGGGGGGGGYSAGPPPSGGSWTAAKGQAAVRRAIGTLGTPYAWAGGGAYGPSYGVCDASNGAPNDCHVYGYDCSGLAMFAWGQGWAHYAATQYLTAGSYHPSAGNLMPGDLIFWSFNGAVSGIHHVAIYKGGGQIIEAPFSGGYVRVEPLYEYGGFFGATRPLS